MASPSTPEGAFRCISELSDSSDRQKRLLGMKLVDHEAAIVFNVLARLASIIEKETRPGVRLVDVVNKKVLKKLTNNLGYIQPVLVDVAQNQAKDKKETDDPRAVPVDAAQNQAKDKYKTDDLRALLQKLKDTCHDLEDVLDQWNTAMLKRQVEGADQEKVHFMLPSSCIYVCDDFSHKVKELSENLPVINKDKSVCSLKREKSSSFVVVPEIFGRDKEKGILVAKLCESGKGIRSPHILSIVGIAGVGKTTLAQFGYNDSIVVNYFDTRIWMRVSDPFDELTIAKSIVKALKGVVIDRAEVECLLQWISQSVVGKKLLLVLDDISIKDYKKWKPFDRCLKNCLPGSKILITTRDQNTVACMINSRDQNTMECMIKSNEIITIKELPEVECWQLFKHFAFFGSFLEDREKLEDIGWEILVKCKCLPFAAKIMGSFLHFKDTEEQWKEILNSDMWKLEAFEKDHFLFFFLSYNDLPSMIKRCLSYCVIFPKDYNMNEDQLIKLWMAQGFLGSGKYQEMETKGQEYFDYLVRLSFFDVVKKDHDDSGLYYKMHDLIHDFLQFLHKFECLTVEVKGEDPFRNFSHKEVYHLMLMVVGGASVPVSFCKVKKLQSLIIRSGVTNPSLLRNAPVKLFDQLKSLRALDLSAKRWYGNLVEEIPTQIGKLRYLRYLNLSSLKVKQLPETLCELYQLQTLELSWCTNLKNLPPKIGNLINLRHIVNNGTSLDYMPKGIERLTCLQTLSEFFVAGDSDSYGSKACTLECLENLNNLRGSLSIKRLGNMTNIVEAKKAELKKKKNVLFLQLNFEKDVEDGMVNKEDKDKRINNDEEILVALQPPPEVERLEIVGYRGHAISLDWVMPLTKLRVLNLYDCMKFEHLPPLGKLPCLESLSVWNMTSVKKVGNEFCGIGDGEAVDKVFPKLVSLKFVNMEEWEEWEFMPTDTWKDAFMPCLSSLSFVCCPKLKKVPEHILENTTLKDFHISWCPFLKECYSHLRGEDTRFLTSLL